MKWISTSRPGVRYYEHQDRKIKGKPDRYFAIRYYDAQGVRRGEGLGWASEGWNVERAADELGEITRNIRRGKGPQSLREKRLLLQDAQARAEAERDENARKKVTLNEVADIYMDWAREHKKHPRHDESLLRLNIRPVFGAMALEDITPSMVEAWRKEIAGRFSPATLRHNLTLLRRLYNFASRSCRPGTNTLLYTGDSPCRTVSMPLVDNMRERFLSHEEADRLIESTRDADPEMADVILFALHTGCRRNEIETLLWEHVDLAHGVIAMVEPESTRGRGRKKGLGRVYINETLRPVLERRHGARTGPFVFPSRKTGGLRHDMAAKFKSIVDALGFNKEATHAKQRLTFHSLRHTFASWLAMNGTPLLTIKELMRHKTLDMVMRYAHLSPDTKRDALESLHRPACGEPSPGKSRG